MLQEGGDNSIPSSMALCVIEWNTSYKRGATSSLFRWHYVQLNRIVSLGSSPCSTSSLRPFFFVFSDCCCSNHCNFHGCFLVGFGYVSFLGKIDSFVFTIVLLEECARMLSHL